MVRRQGPGQGGQNGRAHDPGRDRMTDLPHSDKPATSAQADDHAPDPAPVSASPVSANPVSASPVSTSNVSAIPAPPVAAADGSPPAAPGDTSGFAPTVKLDPETDPPGLTPEEIEARKLAALRSRRPLAPNPADVARQSGRRRRRRRRRSGGGGPVRQPARRSRRLDKLWRVVAFGAPAVVAMIVVVLAVRLLATDRSIADQEQINTLQAMRGGVPAVGADAPVRSIAGTASISYEALLARYLAAEPARLRDRLIQRAFAHRYACDEVSAAGSDEFKRVAIYERQVREMTTIAARTRASEITFTTLQPLRLGEYNFQNQSFPVELPEKFHFVVNPENMMAGRPICGVHGGLPASFNVDIANVSGFNGIAMQPDEARNFLANRMIKSKDNIHMQPDRRLVAEITYRIARLTPLDPSGSLDGGPVFMVDTTAEMVGFRVFADAHGPIFTADAETLASRLLRARALAERAPVLNRWELDSDISQRGDPDGAVPLHADQLPLIYSALSDTPPPIEAYLDGLPSVATETRFSAEREAAADKLRPLLQLVVADAMIAPTELKRVRTSMQVGFGTTATALVPLTPLGSDGWIASVDLGGIRYGLVIDPATPAVIQASVGEAALANNSTTRIATTDLLLKPVGVRTDRDGYRVIVARLQKVQMYDQRDRHLFGQTVIAQPPDPPAAKPGQTADKKPAAPPAAKPK